jgi:hypothetical protein
MGANVPFQLKNLQLWVPQGPILGLTTHVASQKVIPTPIINIILRHEQVV